MKEATREDQAAKSFPTPPRWTFKPVTRAQSFVYEKSGGRLWTHAMGMHHLLLRTTGRKSGQPFVACLPYWLDVDLHRIVVASYGGADRHPGWYHNLADRDANPQVIVRDKRDVYWATAQVLAGEERAALWKEMVLDRPFYDTYQASTSREIPVVRLIRDRAFTG